LPPEETTDQELVFLPEEMLLALFGIVPNIDRSVKKVELSL